MVMQSMFENLYPEVASCIALGDDVRLGRKMLLALELQTMGPNYSELRWCMSNNSFCTLRILPTLLHCIQPLPIVLSTLILPIALHRYFRLLSNYWSIFPDILSTLSLLGMNKPMSPLLSI